MHSTITNKAFAGFVHVPLDVNSWKFKPTTGGGVAAVTAQDAIVPLPLTATTLIVIAPVPLL
jgi:hypothetical protein